MPRRKNVPFDDIEIRVTQKHIDEATSLADVVRLAIIDSIPGANNVVVSESELSFEVAIADHQSH